MRDGQGNKASSEDAAKVRAVATQPDKTSINMISIDPRADKQRSFDRSAREDENAKRARAQPDGESPTSGR